MTTPSLQPQQAQSTTGVPSQPMERPSSAGGGSAPPATTPAADVGDATTARADLTTQIVQILGASTRAASGATRTHALPGFLLAAGLAVAFCGPVLAALRVPQVDWFTPPVGIAGYVCGTILAVIGGVLGLLSHVLPVKWDDEARQAAVQAAVAVESERLRAEALMRQSTAEVARLMEQRRAQSAGGPPA